MATPSSGNAQDVPLLRTKLHIPPVRPDASTTPSTLLRAGPRTRLVSRPRLLERLTAGLQRKLTFVSAPAGFGKTTLLGEWVASCGRPVAWLSLDEGDNDPARFWPYFIAAVQSNPVPTPEPSRSETPSTTTQPGNHPTSFQAHHTCPAGREHGDDRYPTSFVFGPSSDPSKRCFCGKREER
jgi:hypothetical protein